MKRFDGGGDCEEMMEMSEEMEKGEVVCEDAGYKMQDASQTCIMYTDGVISKSQLPNPNTNLGYGFISDKNEIKSEVETALIRDCFSNLFSLDKIPQLRYNSDISKEVINFRVVEICKIRGSEESQWTSPLVSFVMMRESEKNDGLSGFVYFKFENEIFGDMDSSLTFKFISQRFIVDWVQDNLPYFILKNFFQNGILLAGPINLTMSY